MKRRYWLLLLVPCGLALHYLGAPSVVVFLVAAASLIPLSGILGESTESLAGHLGESWGGLLNATFGNAVELILVLVACRAGNIELVKASIIGSILGTLLLVTGASAFVAGVKYGTVKFNNSLVTPSITSLLITMVSVSLPSAVHYLDGDGPTEKISLAISSILIVMYVCTLIKQFRTPNDEVVAKTDEVDAVLDVRFSQRTALTVLAVTTLVIIWVSEVVVGHIESFCHAFHFTTNFVGLIIVPLIGNVAENYVAVKAAAKARMVLSLTISIGSATQIGLFVAPIAVLISPLLGHPIDLVFPVPMLIGVIAATAFTDSVLKDGRVNWLEGVQLIGFHLVIASVCYFT